APGAPAPARPRVRLQCTTSKPPEPSARRRAWTLTTTSSPTSHGPTSPTSAHAFTRSASPATSTSSRAPSATTTVARRSSSTTGPGPLRLLGRRLEEREGHVEHRLQGGDADPLGRLVV